MSFSAFYEKNSKKISRTIIVVMCTVITGMLLCVPLFRDLNAGQIKMIESSKMGWFAIYIIIVRWFREKDYASDGNVVPGHLEELNQAVNKINKQELPREKKQ